MSSYITRLADALRDEFPSELEVSLDEKSGVLMVKEKAEEKSKGN